MNLRVIVLIIISLMLIGNAPKIDDQNKTKVIDLLTTLPVSCYDTETPDERLVRLNTIASAIEKAAAKSVCEGVDENNPCTPIFRGSKNEMLILLVTIGFWESRYSQNVHEGKCKPWECDPMVQKDSQGRTIKITHRSRTNWQLQYNDSIKNEWPNMVGTSQEATDLAAWASAKMLSKGYNSCGTIWGAISKYAGVKHCKWEKGKSRVDFFNYRTKMLLH